MRIIRVSDVGLERAAEEAAYVLSRGGIVLYPTDTLYGLGVDALHETALSRLRQLKGRERKKPMSIIVPTHDALHEHAELHEEARAFAQKYLPGPLTLVARARPHLPEDVVLAGAVGLRIPDDPVAQAISYVFGRPFTATSANRSGHETRHEPMDIVVALGPQTDLVDLVIDDGPRSGGTPSTVVRFIDDTPHILRPGKLTAEELGL